MNRNGSQPRRQGEALPKSAGNCRELPIRTDALTARQRRAVEALADGATCKAAAKAARCSVRTLYGWRQMPAFILALDYERWQRSERVRMLHERRAVVIAEGLEVVVRQVAEDPDLPPDRKLRAPDGSGAHCVLSPRRGLGYGADRRW